MAIIGSRRRKDEEVIRAFVRSLPSDTIVVSGGAKGVDQWAENEAIKRGLKVEIYYPDLTGTKTYYEKVKKFYERNKRIVVNSDVIHAFVTPNRKGGTENTISWAKKLGKPVVIH